MRRTGRATSRWVRTAGTPRLVRRTLTTCPQSDVFSCRPHALYLPAVRASRSPFFGRGTIRDVTAVVGSGVATAWRFCDDCVAWPDGGRDGAGSDRSLLRHLSREGNGDGNGPVFSATFGSDRRSVVSPVRRYLFACGIDHAGLMHDVDLLAPTVPYPTGDAPPVCDAVLGRSPCSISTTSG